MDSLGRICIKNWPHCLWNLCRNEPIVGSKLVKACRYESYGGCRLEQIRTCDNVCPRNKPYYGVLASRPSATIDDDFAKLGVLRSNSYMSQLLYSSSVLDPATSIPK